MAMPPLPVHLVCTQTCSAQTSILLLPFASSCICPSYLFLPQRGHLQAAASRETQLRGARVPSRHRTPVWDHLSNLSLRIVWLIFLAPWKASRQQAQPSLLSGGDTGLSLLPSSLLHLITARFTPISAAPAPAPLEHQLPLRPLSSPSAAGWHAQGHWPAADGQTPEGMEPACLFLLQWLRRQAECPALPRLQAGAAGGGARRGRRKPSLLFFQEKLIWKRENSPTIPASRWGVGQLPSLLMDPSLIHWVKKKGAKELTLETLHYLHRTWSEPNVYMNWRFANWQCDPSRKKFFLFYKWSDKLQGLF